MDHRNDINKSIRLLLALFCGIVLTENLTGAGNSGVIVFIGIILIGLCLLAFFLPGRNGRDLLKDR
jgi:hypothetical protein